MDSYDEEQVRDAARRAYHEALNLSRNFDVSSNVRQNALINGFIDLALSMWAEGEKHGIQRERAALRKDAQARSELWSMYKKSQVDGALGLIEDAVKLLESSGLTQHAALTLLGMVSSALDRSVVITDQPFGTADGIVRVAKGHE